MNDDNERMMDDEPGGTDEPDAENVPDDMTEQIEATFGPISVYVSGTDTEDVQETFDHVWKTMVDTSEKMKDLKDEGDDGDGPTQTFQ